MGIDQAMQALGEQRFLALAGLLIGTAFGVAAQRSRFCMRSAVIDFCHRHGQRGHRMLAVWLLAFSTALIGVQALAWAGQFDVGVPRQMSSGGSLSGAIVGGLLLGIGMILARGCPSRMLVLCANGNLRAFLAGMFFVLTAQATIGGLLSPLREWISGWWTVDAAGRNLLARLGADHATGVLVGVVWLGIGLYYMNRTRLRLREWLGGIAVGAIVVFAWWLNYRVSLSAFDLIVPVQAISFTNPSTEVLMGVLTVGGESLSFGIGLVPGVILGSFLASQASREFRVEGFGDQHNILRYLAGAGAMGLGGVLAVGCSIGAGVSGASLFNLTAWVALVGMWAGAAATHLVMDRTPG